MGLLTGRVVAVTLLLVLLAVPIGVTAQTANGTVQQTDAGPQNVTRTIQVSERVTVVDYSYADGQMTVELEATARVPIDVADLFGSIPDSGGATTVKSRTVSIPKGRSSVTIPARPFNGLAVVTVSAPGGAVTLAERTSNPILGGPWSASDARAAGAGGLVSAFVLVGGYGYRKVRGIATSPERLI